MSQFIEERLNPNVDYGSGFGSAYRNWIVRTIGRSTEASSTRSLSPR